MTEVEKLAKKVYAITKSCNGDADLIDEMINENIDAQ